MKRIISLALVLIICLSLASAQNGNRIGDCSARLENGVLTIENSMISRTYRWNNGNICTTSLTNKVRMERFGKWTGMNPT